jgi:hypothetical protein
VVTIVELALGIRRAVTEERGRRRQGFVDELVREPRFPSCSAVAFAAIHDAQNIDPVTVVVKAYAPVSDPQAELGRMHDVESHYVTCAGIGETLNGARDAQSNSPIKIREVLLRLHGHHEAFRHEGSW